LIEESGCSSISALTLPPTAKARASAISWRVPTKPRMVMQFATTSKSGTGNSPGGSPTKTQVPRFRVIPMPCLNAMSEGAVIRTLWAPPPVAFLTAAAGSPILALITKSAPRCVAWARLPLRRGLLDHCPRIVHFAGHGEGADGILVENDQGQASEIPNDTLADLFELCAGHIECVVLNACYSDVQADAIAKHIPYVIGMKALVSDEAALQFSTSAAMTPCSPTRSSRVREFILPRTSCRRVGGTARAESTVTICA